MTPAHSASRPGRFRRATADDADELVRLERAAFGDQAWSRRAIHGWLDEVPSGVSAWVDDQLRAYGAFRHVLDEAELLRLATRPDARRLGLARGLLEHAAEAYRALGVTSCHLEVRADNDGAVGLYERLGFERVGRRDGYYRDGCAALLYRLDW